MSDSIQRQSLSAEERQILEMLRGAIARIAYDVRALKANAAQRLTSEAAAELAAPFVPASPDFADSVAAYVEREVAKRIRH